MAVYKTDLDDLYFNLFKVNKVQDHSQDFTEEDLKEIVREYDKFVEREIFPTRIEGDEEGLKLENGQVITPQCYKKVHKLFYENGWFALSLPEEIGGTPVPDSVGNACLAIGTAANVSYMMYPGLTRAALNVVLKIGTDKQKDTIIKNMIEGTWGGTMCLTEAEAGSDVGALKTTATPLGEGKYKIKGTKIFISSGQNDLYENIIHLVLARTPGAPKGTKGISLFVVPRDNINEDGSSSGKNNDVSCTKIEDKMGLHSQATCVLNFGEENECVGELIGEEFQGMPNMFNMMNEARLLCGIQGESQGNLAIMLTEQYIKERAQFGKEIINHPDVKRTFLKMRAMGRGLRSLIFYCSDLFDQLHNDPDNKQMEREIGFITPIIKSYASDQGFLICCDALGLHGGYGYCREYGIEQFVRDVKKRLLNFLKKI